MSISLLFVLNSRFPTDKAYGVTTEYTLRAISKIKKFDVKVVTPIKDQNFKTNLKVTEVTMPFKRIFELFSLKVYTDNKVLFIIKNILYALKLSYLWRSTKPMIWSRDILMSLIFRLFGFKVICEIHRTPSSLYYFLLSFLKKFQKVKFIFISKHLQKKLNIDKRKCVIAGMSVNDYELNFNKFSSKKTKFRVGYIGTPQSSENILDIKLFIDTAAAVEALNLNIVFDIIGFNIDRFNWNTKLPQNIKFVSRVARSKIISKLDLFNVGLVIYPNTPYFQDSFPIKIVEYAARKIPIVASDTLSHRRILGKNKALFFNEGSSADLANCILALYKNDILRKELALNAYDWAKKQTYQKRALRISRGISNI
jgi:glycosyltransferase involved in cell wall biosynthesis